MLALSIIFLAIVFRLNTTKITDSTGNDCTKNIEIMAHLWMSLVLMQFKQQNLQ